MCSDVPEIEVEVVRKDNSRAAEREVTDLIPTPDPNQYSRF